MRFTSAQAWSRVFSPTNPLIIRAADPNNKPVFAGLSINGAQGITLQNLHFQFNHAGWKYTYTADFQINSSDHMKVLGCFFEGEDAYGMTGGNAVDNGFPTGTGLSIGSSNNVTIDGTEIKGFYRGLIFASCDNCSATNNNIWDIRSDGINPNGVDGLLIQGNHIHDWRRSFASGDHCDMIQSWMAGQRFPSKNVTISGNLFDIGTGNYAHGIAFFDTDKPPLTPEIRYENIVIEDNILLNSHSNGIIISSGNGVIIRRNQVLKKLGTPPHAGTGVGNDVIPRISGSGENFTITDNILNRAVEGGGINWTVAGNTITPPV